MQSIGVKRSSADFVSSGSLDLSEPAKKKTALFNLRTGEPFDVHEKDIHGRTRSVSEFEKLNRVGEGTYGIVYRARDTKTNELGRHKWAHFSFLAFRL